MDWGVVSTEVEEPSYVALMVRLRNLEPKVMGTREVRLKKRNNKIRFVL